MSKDKKKNGGDYDVGYGKPPKEHQFKPGETGNAKGRPPKPIRLYSGDQIADDFLASIEQKITVTRDGKKTTVPTIWAIYDQQVLKAAKGDTRSAKFVVDLLHIIIGKKEKALVELIETVFEIDKHYSDDAAANPHLADEIKADQAAYRRSPEVLDAFSRVRRPMPRRGKLTREEDILNRTIDLPWDLSEIDTEKSQPKKISRPKKKKISRPKKKS